ncbi:MAG: hypothetical protein J1E31_02870 [Helicobacter sp.]|nr:hypothetical protein [Helicobacter sp.]
MIFATGVEKFDKEAYEQCSKRDIAICISFPSGSFVRTSQKNATKFFGLLSRFLRGSLYRKWSNTDLG